MMSAVGMAKRRRGCVRGFDCDFGMVPTVMMLNCEAVMGVEVMVC